ncbi:DNA recombination protein RmuC [Rhodanobacter sp. ANJX3]|uniref:DNA recombination protein RmuC n=1 Tax=unclassified Rhodanobacter TaxID=2621553 RepID=UPI0015C892C0|nr:MULTISPECIES: DNA recombination protein RmuC [unclassified Rhodanobacter]MBB5359309.1 DNA recombination protein RmuC [Rhodanobacter sp. ANJX3]NYE29939.1 DNA recombination protein RmuC [Rhodanobacter sp. K2T2]
MPAVEILLIVLLVAVLIVLVLQVLALRRGREDAGLHIRLDALKDDGERLQRTLREEQRAGRDELQQGFDRFRSHVGEQLGGMSQQQAERIDGFALRLTQLTERTDAGLQSLAQRLTEDARRSREESTLTLNRLGDQQQQRLVALTADIEKRMTEVRTTLETKLGAMQQDNAAKLEQMRATVDEKLQSTLETRLGQSFKLVSERLEAVQRGLGEMQSLAVGVGDLKRVLGNVKRRGILGEVQLGGLLEDLLTNEQYATNVATVPGSSERVEYAIRMPGQEDGENVYLPIDSKFPVEDYQRLLDAQDAADVEAAALAGRALEVRVRDEAKRIKSKYVAAPHTTDFAVLFLPTEGLYAEVLRRPGLFESLQRDHRVMVAGPTTLSALLNSLQMGFRTLAIAKRSSEVWKLLGVVKNEFGKFGLVLEKAERQLNTVSKSISDAGKKTKTIERKLRGVESIAIEDPNKVFGTPSLDVADDLDTEADQEM